MTDCRYCGNEIQGYGYENIDFHSECMREWVRRDKHNLCARCGKDIAPIGKAWCGACNETSDYLGYPGGPK